MKRFFSLRTVLVVGMVATLMLLAGTMLSDRPANNSGEPLAGLQAGGEPPDEWVVVRVAETAPAMAEGGLADQGYRSVPVPKGQDRETFMAALRQQPGVVEVTEDAEVFAAATPTDALYPSAQAPYLGPIGAPDAWDVTTGQRRVVVAVLDTGIDPVHPELAGQIWVNPNEIPANGVDDDGNGCVDDAYGCRFVNLTQERADACGYTVEGSVPNGNVKDDHGRPGDRDHSHGTLVAGIIGAAGNNGTGVTGVAWAVTVMPVKVLDCGTPQHAGQPNGSIANVAQGIDYARRMGAQVINLSLAGTEQADVPILRDAIQAAQNAGVLIVAAAGNHAPGRAAPVGYPAAYTQYWNVLAVGASDPEAGNTWASYSNYGPAVDFAAPGNDIASTVRTDMGNPTPYGVAREGTSFSTPIASGMFALMMSRNSRLPTARLVEIARAAASPPEPAPHNQNWAGSGIVHLGRAVSLVPLTVTGAALHDWKDVPANSQVRALVDGKLCGETTTASSLVARFGIEVRTAVEQAGCGAPGKQVQLSINGRMAQRTFAWGGRDEDIALDAGELSTVSPPPGSTVQLSLGSGWNNLPHLGPSGSTGGVLSYLTPGWEIAVTWTAGVEAYAGPGTYRSFAPRAPSFVSDWGTAETYEAFWVQSEPGLVTIANPLPATGRTLLLHEGWNNFVYTGKAKPVAEALQEVAGSFQQVLQYDNATGAWQFWLQGQSRYLNDFGGLLPLRVYWVYMTEPGTITMD